MRNESILKRISLNFFGAVFLIITVTTFILCTGACMSIKNRIINEEQETLRRFVWETQTTVNEGLDRATSIITWPLIIENLSYGGMNSTQKYEFAYNVKLFIDNMANGENLNYIIYTSNEDIFSSKYIEKMQSLNGAENIISRLESEEYVVEDEIFEDWNGKKYLKLYENMYIGDGSILEIDVYFPDADKQYNIDIVKNDDAYANGETREMINDLFSASLITDRARIIKKQFKAVLIIVIAALALFALVMMIVYAVSKRTLNGVYTMIDSLSDERFFLAERELRVAEDDSSELKVIKQAVNRLVDTIRSVTESRNKIENDKKTLNIYMLQKQLDPHTLYNSLSAIRLRAFMAGNNDIVTLVDHMISYYRRILNKGDMYITLKDEVEVIDKFLKVTGLAYDQDYKLISNIDDQLKSFKIPVMLLHVFAENSVVHGFGGRKDTQCYIDIKAENTDDYVYITIKDNGYGMDEKKISELNGTDENGMGYGIKNARVRMKLLYGDKATLRFESELYNGTTVKIKLPLESPEV